MAHDATTLLLLAGSSMVLACSCAPRACCGFYLLQNAEFDIKKEAAWAISNATSGGTAEQLKYLVDAKAIKPLCDLLNVPDVRIVTVALEGLENILKVCMGGFAVAFSN